MTLFDQSVEQMAPQKLINPKALSRSFAISLAARNSASSWIKINPLAEVDAQAPSVRAGAGGLEPRPGRI